MSNIVNIKDAKIRQWVRKYIEIRNEKGTRHALAYVRSNVPPEDQETFGEYVRAHNEENINKLNKKINKDRNDE